MFQQKPGKKVFVGVRLFTGELVREARAGARSSLALLVLLERADRRAEPAGHDVVGVVAQNERRFEELSSKLKQENLRFNAANEVVAVRTARDLTENMHRFGELITASLGEDGELAAAKVDNASERPLVQRSFREKNPILHSWRDYITAETMGERLSANAAYEELLSLGASDALAAVVADMRRTFERRAGAFGPDDAWFEARGRAFWDDALTVQAFGTKAGSAVAATAREWAGRFAHAHRGLFRATHAAGSFVLTDVWGGAEFAIDHPTEALASELEAGASDGDGENQLFDGRLVGAAAPFSVVLLPGAVFHRAEATDAVLAVVVAAKSKDMQRDEALDALLRMDRKLQSHARVKASYAYRAELLAQPQSI